MGQSEARSAETLGPLVHRGRFFVVVLTLLTAAIVGASLFSIDMRHWDLRESIKLAVSACILGAALISVVYPILTHAVAALFAALAGYNAITWWMGRDDCGCFAVMIHPQWTLLAVVVLACAWYWAGKQSELLARWRQPRHLMLLALMAACAGMIANVALIAHEPRAVTAGDALEATDGRSLPPSFTAVLYRSGCAKCVRFLHAPPPDAGIAQSPTHPVLLIDLDQENAHWQFSASPESVRLPDVLRSRFRTMQIPAVLRIDHGQVTGITDYSSWE